MNERLISKTAGAFFALLFAAIMLVVPAQAFAGTDNFAVLADPHVRGEGDDGLVTNNADALRAFKWASKVSGLDAVIVAGDLTDRGYSDDFITYNSLWQKTQLSVPRIQVIGNHDTNHGGAFSGLSVGSCAASFKSINNGKINDYREFENANVMTISGPYRAGGNGVYTKAMLKTLNANLKKTVRQGKMAIVVSHYPYRTTFPNYKRLLSILKSYPNVIFISGHRHYNSASHWMKKVKPKELTKMRVKATPYKRTGIKAKKVAYTFKSLAVDSVARNHDVGGGFWQSAGQSIGCSLSVSSNGKIVYKRYSMKSGKCLKTWRTKQTKGSIRVKSVSMTKKKNATLIYRVTFSDGKAHGGIKSGGTFALKTGKSKKISGIPAGVLVSVQCVDGPAGWSKAKKAKIEVTNKTRNVVIKHTYKKPKNVPSSSTTMSSSTSSSTESSTESSSEGTESTSGSEDPESSSTSGDEQDPSSSSTEGSESTSGGQDDPSDPGSSSSSGDEGTAGDGSSSSTGSEPTDPVSESSSSSEATEGEGGDTTPEPPPTGGDNGA